MVYCEITREPLDAAALLAKVRSDSDGALLLFAGVVRNHDGGRTVEGLRYEAYEEMALAKLQTICSEILARGEIGDVALAHRTGELVVGELSVVIAVASPHRDAAYRASREIIERLKREVPIWKEEHYADGERGWVEGSTPPLPRSG